MAHDDPKTRNMTKAQRAKLPHYDQNGNVKPEFRSGGGRAQGRGAQAQRRGSAMRRRR